MSLTQVERTRFFGSLPKQGVSGVSATAEKAIRSFAAFCGDTEIDNERELDAKLRDWLVHFQMNGNSLSTAVRYLKALSGRHTQAVREGVARPTDIFKTLLATLKEAGEGLWQSNITPETFGRFIAFTKKAAHNAEAISLWSDLVIFSLLNGCMPLEEVARLKSGNCPDLCAESKEIIARNHRSKTQYLFPLDQGNLTPRQLQKLLSSFIAKALAEAGISSGANGDDTLRSLWAFGALTAGFPPATVRSYLGTVPAEMRILSLCRATELTAAEKREMIAVTAPLFTDNPLRWYAMHLRARVTYDALTEKLGRIRAKASPAELFYPSKEIARKVGKRKVFENQPVIRDIVYFKTRATNIGPLFCQIGDIAWCYKNDGRNGSSYAVIPEASFRRFQEAIGCFTPEYAAYFADLEPLKENDDIVITGGVLNGYCGKLQKVLRDTPGGIIRYIVEVWEKQTARSIHGEIDARQVRKL